MQTNPVVPDDDVAEAEALRAAVAEAMASGGDVSHAAVRAWLLRIAAGEFDAPPPAPDTA